MQLENGGPSSTPQSRARSRSEFSSLPHHCGAAALPRKSSFRSSLRATGARFNHDGSPRKRSAGGKNFASAPARPFGAFSTSATRLTYLTEPPNLSGISDPNVVVSFKNVLKKDSTTKTKALEDLLAYVQALNPEGGGTERCGPRCLGPGVSSTVGRQRSAGARALPYPPACAHEISSEAHGEAHTAGCRDLARRHLRQRPRRLRRPPTDSRPSSTRRRRWQRCGRSARRRSSNMPPSAVAETPDTLSDERSNDPRRMRRPSTSESWAQPSL